MEIITNNKGGLKLCYEGFSYTKKEEGKTTRRWECSRRKALGCNGKITTNLEANEIMSRVKHNHESSNSMIEANEKKLEMKSIAYQSRGNTSQVLADSLEKMSEEGRLAMGNYDSIKRQIQRSRQTGRPKDPNSLEELIIPEEWTTTGEESKKPFLIYDNGHEEQNRIIIFSTQECMQLLSKSNIWFMDGTFSSAPVLFHQLFVIRAPLGDSAVSCIYALLSGKTQIIYEELFKAIINKADEMGLDLNPTTTMTDFERSILNAITTSFGQQVRTKTCYFHLTQNTWRKLQNLNLVNKYKEDKETRIYVGMIDGLAFLPVDKVLDGMNYLKEICPEHLKPILEYFDSTYVTGTTRRNRIVPPIYPPEKWNVYEATIEEKARTNNLCESWNNGFKHLVGYNHPTIWALIEALRKDAIMIKNQIRKEKLGEPIKKRVRRETKNLQERLNYICNEFTNGNKSLHETLYTIACNLKF
jgi:hypothetical protein